VNASLGYEPQVCGQISGLATFGQVLFWAGVILAAVAIFKSVQARSSASPLLEPPRRFTWSN
jgi:hypothetical protein